MFKLLYNFQTKPEKNRIMNQAKKIVKSTGVPFSQAILILLDIYRKERVKIEKSDNNSNTNLNSDKLRS